MSDHSYTFGLILAASVTVSAPSREEAERVVNEITADSALIELKDHEAALETLRGEASRVGEPHLSLIDGHEPEPTR